MRVKGILAGGALLGLAIGATAASAQPMGTVPPAGAYYGDGALPAPGISQWQGSGPMPHGHMDHRAIGDLSRDPTYAVNDWQAWGLTPPGPGMHWMRYYGDAVLVDASGHVVDTRHGMAWDQPRGPMPGYAGGPGYPPPGYGGPGWHGGPNGGTTVYHAGPNTTVTTQVIGGAPGYGYGYGYAGGGYAVGAGTMYVIPGSVITTTTTTSDEIIYKNRYHRAWRRPVRHYHPRCVQAPSCPVVGS